MFEVLYLGRGSCGTWEEEGAGGGENTAVAEPESRWYMTYIHTFTYIHDSLHTFIFCFTRVYQVPIPYAIPVY